NARANRPRPSPYRFRLVAASRSAAPRNRRASRELPHQLRPALGLLANIVEPLTTALGERSLADSLALPLRPQTRSADRRDLRRQQMPIRLALQVELDHRLEDRLAQAVLLGNTNQLALQLRLVAEAG